MLHRLLAKSKKNFYFEFLLSFAPKKSKIIIPAQVLLLICHNCLLSLQKGNRFKFDCYWLKFLEENSRENFKKHNDLKAPFAAFSNCTQNGISHLNPRSFLRI